MAQLDRYADEVEKAIPVRTDRNSAVSFLVKKALSSTGVKE
jgi:hypothetical protein